VLVNAEDRSLQQNRLALMARLAQVMNVIADLSRLAS
jgi:glycyl-tRNA synthetase beta subunit